MKSRDEALPRYPMRVVVSRTGLNASRIRAWERRYGAFEPERSDGGHRLYSDDDIRKFQLLRDAVEIGHPISAVAALSLAELRELVARGERRSTRRERRAKGKDVDGAGAEGDGAAPRSGMRGEARAEIRDLLARAVEAAHAMDTRALDRVLRRAAILLGPNELLDAFLQPLLERCGLLSGGGEIRPASTEVVAGTLRGFQRWLLDALGASEPGPLVVIRVPEGRSGEFEASLIAIAAATVGWAVLPVDAGPSGPVLADVARRKGASAIVLPVPDAGGEPVSTAEVRAIRGKVGRDVALVLCGAGAVMEDAETASAGRAGVERIEDRTTLREWLRR